MPHHPRVGLTLAVAAAAVLAFAPHSVAQSSATATLRSNLEEVARLAGEPRTVSAAGLTRRETPLLTIEDGMSFETPAAQRRLVIVGGLDGVDSARIALAVVRWFKTAAPASYRREWTVSVLPLADPDGNGAVRPYAFPPAKGFFEDPEQPESRYVWRWVEYQAPDLVLEIRAGDQLRIQPSAAGTAQSSGPGSLATALSNGSLLGTVASILVTARLADAPAILGSVLPRAPAGRAALHRTIDSRVARDPLAVARLLAQRYPAVASMSYIPALSWVHALKVASITGDTSLRAKVIGQVQRWLSGTSPLFDARLQLTAIAGTMVFAELAKSGGDVSAAAAKLAAEGFARAAEEKAPGSPQYGQEWTDDMFMASVVLANAGTPEGRDAAARLLVAYAARLQQPSGLFIHAANAPAAWGRGNGFAAFGLMETLSALPADHEARAPLLDIFRRQMAAMKTHQAPDGMWRQVVDIPGSYREQSVTAMTLTAMARGLRLGWLDQSYLPVVRKAWPALLSHITADGEIVDVCTSTGAGPSLRYYLDRTAISGPDDRGGAMALGAALEMYELNKAR